MWKTNSEMPLMIVRFKNNIINNTLMSEIIAFDGVRNINEPRKVVLDFYNYVEIETQIGLDIPALSGTSTWVTTLDKKFGTFCMPAEYYAIKITRYNLIMEIRYCLCPGCNKIIYIEIFSSKEKRDKDNANQLLNLLETLVPDIPVFISYHPDEIPIIQLTSSLRENMMTGCNGI